MMSDEQRSAPVPWPVRVIAVLIVLPVRVLWEIIARVGIFFLRYVGRPIAWLVHYAVVVPLRLLWRYLVVVPGLWLLRTIAAGLAWFWEHAIAAPLSWLYRFTLPAWKLLGRALLTAGAAVVRWMLRPIALAARWLLHQLYRWLLRPAGLAAGWVFGLLYRWILRPGWQGAGWLLHQVWRAVAWTSRQLYRWLLRPAGLALTWVWRWTAVPAWHLTSATARWVRTTILRPAADSVRSALNALGLGN